MVTRVQWAKSFLRWGGFPVTKRNLWAVVVWVTAEGCMARWNPLATTRNVTGATNWNSVGVKEYLSEETGLDATLATLEEPGHGYEPIVAGLRASQPAFLTLRAIRRSEWGTTNADGRLLRFVKRHWADVAFMRIGQ